MAAKVKEKPVETIAPEVHAPELTPAELKKMAKEEKIASKKNAKLAKNKGGKGKLIAFFIILLLVGAMAAVLVFNVFDLRDKYVVDLLRNVPIVNNLLPEKTAADDQYAGKTKEQLILEIQTLQTQIDNNNAAIDKLNKDKASDVAEITRLQKIEGQQLDYEAKRKQFDTEIASGDPVDYQKYYEDMNKANQQELYNNAVADIAASKELKKYISTFSAMDETAAAEALELLVPTDMNLVVRILTNLDNDSKAAILGQMTAPSRAKVIKQMAP